MKIKLNVRKSIKWHFELFRWKRENDIKNKPWRSGISKKRRNQLKIVEMSRGENIKPRNES